MRGRRWLLTIVAGLVGVAGCGDDGPILTAPGGVDTTTPPEGSRWPGDDENQQPDPVDPLQANLTLIKNELKEYHDSGDYAADLETMVTLAEDCMLAALADAERPALVLDIDETALSNYDWMVSVDFLRASPLLSDLFTEHAETETIPAIEHTLQLYETARSNDIAVFFVTGRPARLSAPTEANLANAGYTDYTDVYFAPNDYSEPSIVPFKSGAREDIEAQGYEIIANIGDQDSDLDGGHGGCPHKLVDPFYFIP